LVQGEDHALYEDVSSATQKYAVADEHADEPEHHCRLDDVCVVARSSPVLGDEYDWLVVPPTHERLGLDAEQDDALFAVVRVLDLVGG
jgi:hypothetical protein